MADQVEKCKTKNILLTKDTSSVKKEGCEKDDLVDDKVHISETAIIIDNVVLQDPATQYNLNKIKQGEVSTILGNIKTELSPSKVEYNMINDTKIEDEITADDIKIKFDNGRLYCEHCHAYYEDYCTKCEMLVHILNRNVLIDAENSASEELPNNILEIQNSFGRFRIFALKVIPKGVKFGPFTGLSRTECAWKIKDRKFVVTNDKSEYLSWMQYINHASNICEQNLYILQCENNLYYQSTCQIQGGEELLVYFGEEYEDRLNRNVEVDFIPTMEHIVKQVFACTFCCLGFSSCTYLAKHRSVCIGIAAEGFSVEELMQCPFCNIYLGQKEYYEHHMAYCCVRKYTPPTTSGNQMTEVKERKTPLRSQLYKCEQCKYRTKYRVDLKHHTNQHYGVKAYKCGICNKRFKAKESLRLHVEKAHDYMNTHIKAEHSNWQDCGVKQLKCSRCEFQTKHNHSLKGHMKTKHLKEFNYSCDVCDYKTNSKQNLETHTKTNHLKEFNHKCGQCDYKTNNNSSLEYHIKTKHLREFNHRCAMCDYKTNNKQNLEVHTKTIHLKEFNYKCEQCDYKTNSNSRLEYHKRTKHLKKFNYNCDMCDYKTNRKSHLETHIKTSHLKEFDYGCDLCDFKTNQKSNLKSHINRKHLKAFNYRCDICDFKTNQKPYFETHIKTKHLKEFNYRCDTCDYQTNHKNNLGRHIKTSHLKEFNYKCDSCDYKTNHKNNLERHIKTSHLKEYDYRCDVCDYKTNQKVRLNDHTRRKHR